MLRASKPSSGRIAATGGIRDALRAGSRTARTVIPTPTRKAMTTAVGLSTMPKLGNPAPAALKMSRISLATPMPAKMPMIVAITDMTSASMTIKPADLAPGATDGA